MILDALGRRFSAPLSRWTGKPWPPNFWRCCCKGKSCDVCTGIPDTLTLTFTSACAAWNNQTVTMTYGVGRVATFPAWYGFFNGCIQFEMQLACDPSFTCAGSGNGNGCKNFTLGITPQSSSPFTVFTPSGCPDGSFLLTTCPDTGCVCSPLNLVFTNWAKFRTFGTCLQCSCTAAYQNITATITV